MSLFKVVQAIQSAGVGVVGLDLRRTVVVLRSVGETAVIRFRCVSQRIEQFGGPHEGKVKRHPVTSATVAHVSVLTMNVRDRRHHQYRHISNCGYALPPPGPVTHSTRSPADL
jgi:hypothetical protein